MRIHYLQHVEFEGPAIISRWALHRGYTLTATKFYRNDTLPEVEEIDLLVVLGGPMKSLR